MSTTHFPDCLKTTNIDINFNANVVTSHTVSTLFAAILDLLMFDRKQIPFVYNTFKYMVEKLDAMTGEEEEWDNYLVERERKLASKTLYSLKMLKRNVAAEIDSMDIDRVLILFGPNALTPREAFEIHLPSVNREHYGKNHIEADNTIARSVSMSILMAVQDFETSSNCKTVFNQSTNVYVLLNPQKSNNFCADEKFQRHDDFLLHPDCRTTIFRLHNMSKTNLDSKNNCCGDLVVYKDLSTLRLDEQDVITKSKIIINGDKCSLNNTTIWFESDVYVQGYKDKHVKGQSIWV